MPLAATLFAATLFKIQSIAPGGYRSRKRLSLLPQYLSRDPGRGVNMEPPEVAFPEAFRKVEKFLVVTVSVAAAAIASDALVKKSLRLSSVDAFSALSAMVAS